MRVGPLVVGFVGHLGEVGTSTGGRDTPRLGMTGESMVMEFESASIHHGEDTCAFFCCFGGNGRGMRRVSTVEYSEGRSILKRGEDRKSVV